MDEKSPTKIFIKEENTIELSGIIYVQQDEKYCIKCSHCELNFELINKFTRHCVENHLNSSSDLPLVDISGNSEDFFGFPEVNSNTTIINEFFNEDPITNNVYIKKDPDECLKNQEIVKNIKIGIEQNIKFEDENYQNKDQSLILQKNNQIIKTSKDLKCTICQKQLLSRSGFLRHVKRQTCGIPTEVRINNTFQCKFCDEEFTKSKLLQHHELQHQRADILTCTHCKSEFRHKKNFLAHLKTHSEQAKPYKCEICSKDFLTSYKLKCHSTIVHSSEPFYKCNQCSKAFRSNHKLREHKSDFHNGPPKHKCQYCPKSFVRLSDLQIHERVHTGEKPYQCEICGKGFAVVSLLTKHNKRHTNERNYKCDICGKCFFSATYLRDHMVTHTKIKSFSCEICDTRFTLRTALIKHRKLHSGIKEYVCKLCGKAYAQGPGLYAHMKTHKLAQKNP